MDIGIVGQYCAGDRLLVEDQEFQGLFDIARSVSTPKCKAQVVGRDVVNVFGIEALGKLFDLNSASYLAMGSDASESSLQK